ncbi:hypothetical protein ONZ45_g10099 [Pleurotus djamor]|nr:hypothetical protein ONZ45_g10099 [Pleurotus djamor]
MSRLLRSALTLSAAVALGVLPSTVAVHFTVKNNCPNALSLYINGENRGVLGDHGGTLESDMPKDWSGDIWSSSYEGSTNGDKSTKASFHLEEGYYFVVSDWSRFNTGISIKPSRGADWGWCPEARCDGPSCSGGYRSRPNHLPPPGSHPPGQPLYRCPGDVSFTVTFCPDGKPPPSKQTPPPPPPQAPGEVHQIHPNGDNRKCLDIRAAKVENGTPVQIYDCNGSAAQKWRIRASPGPTKIQLDGTNFCLDSGLTPGNGVQLKIWQCFDNLGAQKWWYTGDKHIALEGKGQCLDLTGGNNWNGNVIQTWECFYGNKNQIWTL